MELNFKQLKLETERLVLKILDEDSADQVLDYFQRNDEFLMEWEPVKEREFYTVDYQREALRKALSKITDGGTFRVWLFKKEDVLYRTIGSIALNDIVRGAFLSCHLGYRLDRDEINRGYMTEALKKVIEFAFTTLGLHRIQAHILPRNVRSMRVLNKLGFHEEGVTKKSSRINGKWEDHICMALLNETIE